jgi:hypothetical protein
VELAEPTLPWRYTPAPTPTDGSLHPWFVLIVGREGDELTLENSRVTIATSAQQDTQALAGPASPYRFAHVQDRSGQRTTRVLCARPLDPGVAYLAVVVPAYDTDGTPSWNGSAPVTVPAYDYWRFQTATPAGSFENLAAQLHPAPAPASTGRAALDYPHLADAPALALLGALVAQDDNGQIVEDALPSEVQADLAKMRLLARDPQGRPIVTLPHYGDAWSGAPPGTGTWDVVPNAPDDTWEGELNVDPRHRGIAGLGLEVAIRPQEDLVDEVMANLGALREARQRIRHLTLGLEATRSLWERRVPADPTERLWLLGPALNRLVTPNGSVGKLATDSDRTISRGTFSAAARRVLRPGPARTALAVTPPTPGGLVISANRQPPASPSKIDGLPLNTAGMNNLDHGRLQAIAGHVDTNALVAAASDLAANVETTLKTGAGQVATAIQHAVQAGNAVPWVPMLATLAAGDASVVAQSRNPTRTLAVVNRGISGLHGPVGGHGVDPGLIGMLTAIGPQQADDPTLQPVAVDALATGVAAAFDPSTNAAPAAARVLATIEGAVDPTQPLAPPEPCVGLDRAAWADLGAAFPYLLLPGIGQLASDCVIALDSNPIFIDSYLVGLNTQLLGELRWRNIPVATGCTPIRRFWDRNDTASGERTDDIIGAADWASTSELGDPGHRPPGSTGRDLVIAVRGQLFLRYPTTLVYLESAVPAGETAADFDVDPADDAARTLPGFRGRLGDDITFFGFPGLDHTVMGGQWLVFEEPPAGYRFRSDAQTPATTGHDWAVATLAHPVRVLIRGDSLVPGGGP